VIKDDSKYSSHPLLLFVDYPFFEDFKEYLSRRGRNRMVVGFITTCAISAYHH